MLNDTPETDFHVTYEEILLNKDNLTLLMRVKLCRYELEYGTEGWNRLEEDLDELLAEGDDAE